MFKHILVPLDGSALAESSLSAAAYLAELGPSEVTLLHVLEGPHAPNAVHGEHHLTGKVEAERYLHSVAERFFSPRIRVNYHVHDAPVSGVARGIADHQVELDHDLVVMCTHGRSGANNLVFGSIAQRIVSIGTVPVLIVQPAASEASVASFSASPMLLPLDGSVEHERCIEVVDQLASKIHADVHLLMVVPTLRTLPGKWEDTTKLLPTSADRMLEMAAEEAEEYLSARRQALESHGLRVDTEIRRGDPAKVICRSVVESMARMLVLSTHGKSGMSAIWEGSVASRVLSRIDIPVLLVPVAHEEPIT